MDTGHRWSVLSFLYLPTYLCTVPTLHTWTVGQTSCPSTIQQISMTSLPGRNLCPYQASYQLQNLKKFPQT
ncbi:hypothetical protein GGR54DRAFT_248624 [Hypoxylon sp. NC1633]|nr:hypothetical protein GGR54DRAFT_248624 [Hypoxylon sp. NC1633]